MAEELASVVGDPGSQHSFAQAALIGPGILRGVLLM